MSWKKKIAKMESDVLKKQEKATQTADLAEHRDSGEGYAPSEMEHTKIQESVAKMASTRTGRAEDAGAVQTMTAEGQRQLKTGRAGSFLGGKNVFKQGGGDGTFSGGLTGNSSIYNQKKPAGPATLKSGFGSQIGTMGSGPSKLTGMASSNPIAKFSFRKKGF